MDGLHNRNFWDLRASVVCKACVESLENPWIKIEFFRNPCARHSNWCHFSSASTYRWNQWKRGHCRGKRRSDFSSSWETTETLGALEQWINCVRYGVVSCEIQAWLQSRPDTWWCRRGNLVVWNVKNRSDCTDPVEEGPDDMEHAEEESPVSDMEVDPNNRPVGMERLLQNMGIDQNIALAQENWTDSSQIQQATVLVLDSFVGRRQSRRY